MFCVVKLKSIGYHHVWLSNNRFIKMPANKSPPPILHFIVLSAITTLYKSTKIPHHLFCTTSIIMPRIRSSALPVWISIDYRQSVHRCSVLHQMKFFGPTLHLLSDLLCHFSNVQSLTTNFRNIPTVYIVLNTIEHSNRIRGFKNCHYIQLRFKLSTNNPE